MHPYKKGSPLFTFFLGSERWSNGAAKRGEKGQGRHVRSETQHTARDAGCPSSGALRGGEEVFNAFDHLSCFNWTQVNLGRILFHL